MPSNTSLLSYDDVRSILDQALAEPRGVRVKLESSGAAVHFVHRCRAFCKLDRASNKKVYAHDPENPLFGASVYDRLVIRRGAEDEVLIQKRSEITYKVEAL